jgi:hypothetical protein
MFLKISTFLASFIRSVLRIRHEGKAEWKMGHGAKGNMIINNSLLESVEDRSKKSRRSFLRQFYYVKITKNSIDGYSRLNV